MGMAVAPSADPMAPRIVRRLIGGLGACRRIWGARAGEGRAAGAVHERARGMRATVPPPKIGRIAHDQLEAHAVIRPSSGCRSDGRGLLVGGLRAGAKASGGPAS